MKQKIINTTKNTQEKEKIVVSSFEMTHPYGHSELTDSSFHGFFNVCFIISAFFIAVSPLKKYVQKGIFIEEEVLKLLQTNVLWDTITLLIVFTLALIGMIIPKRFIPKILRACIVIGILLTGFLVVNMHSMYHSDRAFIVFLTWSIACKMISYFLTEDKNQTLVIKLMFLISPLSVYQNFENKIILKRKVNITYIIKKFLNSVFCMVANCILIVEIIDPVILEKDKLNFIEFLFRLIPPIFYLCVGLWYLIFENIFAAIAEMTKLKNRKFYGHWWNATNFQEYIFQINLIVDQFIDMLVDNLIAGSQKLKGWKSTLKIAAIVGMYQAMTLQIFIKRVNLMTTAMFILIVLIINLTRHSKYWFNNYIIHFLTICFFPLLITCEHKLHFW